MDTPICDFVREYSRSAKLRLHMPGHKGKAFLGFESLDITEIDGADVLYHADGIIKKSEENASALFGTAKTVYSTEGSSLAVRAMLYLTLMYSKTAGRRAVIAAGRNAHKAFMTAAALLDIDIQWIFPEFQDSIVLCDITGELLDKFLADADDKPIAVYITSPDYLGNMADIEALAKVCRKHGVLLLVDNAHGAYLQFLPKSHHPIALGADMCCDSAHKTLPVLTGGAYLHISHSAPKLFLEQAENAMALFASTSPSYLIMQSLDAVNRYISMGYSKQLADFINSVDAMKSNLKRYGYTLTGSEPLKLTISTKPYGYTGYEFAARLLEHNIVCEFYDPDFVVMMLTPESGSETVEAAEEALFSIRRKPALTDRMPPMAKPERQMSPRTAVFSLSRTLPVKKCIGRVLASATVGCPPAIPIVVCGEIIDAAAVKVFEYYGIESCNVVE